MTKRGYGAFRKSHRLTRDTFVTPPRVEPPEEQVTFNLTGGIMLNGSPREIPLQATPLMENMRFEDTGIRKDFGISVVGLRDNAPARVLGIVEHKFIDNDKLYSRFTRIFRRGSKIGFQVWDGTEWQEGTISALDLNPIPLSVAAIEGKLLIADGTQIAQWDEVPDNTQQDQDFPTGNSLTATGESTAITVTPAEARQDQYIITYNVSLQVAFLEADFVTITSDLPGFGTIVPSLGKTGSVKVHIKDNDGNILHTETYSIFVKVGGGSEAWTQEEVVISHKFADGDTLTLEVEPSGLGVTFSVHGFNKLTDGDALPGLQYDQYPAPADTFALLSADAPAARYIIPFRDRLIALQDEGDPQFVAWSADGISTDWLGPGSGNALLLDVRSDPIDELMAAGAVASNVLALFRRRSIMRVRETGNIAFALAFESWIEGIGTDARFSVQQVKDGVMFLGHDFMVYYFSGATGPTPVGEGIQQALIESLTGDQEFVDSGWDPVFGEYWLGIPEDGVDHITREWIFDLGNFLDSGRQVMRWRTRDIKCFRLTTVSRIE